jgi:hypothetical protein
VIPCETVLADPAPVSDGGFDPTMPEEAQTCFSGLQPSPT